MKTAFAHNAPQVGHYGFVQSTAVLRPKRTGSIGEHQRKVWIMCQSCGIHEPVGDEGSVSTQDKIRKAIELGWKFVPKMKCNNCQKYNL